MSKQSKKVRPGMAQFGQFREGEYWPLRGLWFKVAHVEQGVVILALDGFTKAGLLALARLKAEHESSISPKLETKEETNFVEGLNG